MTKVLILTSLDDHEALFQALADHIADTQAVTRLLDQASKNGNSYPMHLELTELTPIQHSMLSSIIKAAPELVDHFSSTVEQVSVS